MDYNFLKTLGAIAGIGGIALGVVVLIFKEVIRKEIFPKLTKTQSYKLLNNIVILTFVTGVLGVAAYLVVNWRSRNPDNPNPPRTVETPTPTPELAELPGAVLDQNEQPLQGAKVTLDDLPGMQAVETSSDGVFTLKDIPKKYGEGVRIRVVKKGYKPNPYTEDVVIGKAPPLVKLRKIK
jgi:hypothetical protein